MSEIMLNESDRGALVKRGLYMVLFAVLYGVAEFVLTVVVVVQFLVVLISGSANAQLLKLGSALSRYCYSVFRFLSFNQDDKPFPFADWPADDAHQSPWFESDAGYRDVPGSEPSNPNSSNADSTDPDSARSGSPASDSSISDSSTSDPSQER